MSLKTAPSIDHIQFSISPPLQIFLYLVQFLSYLTLTNIVTLQSGSEVTQGHSNGTIRNLGCDFLFAFHSNYGRFFNRL